MNSTESESLKNNPRVPLDFKSLQTIPDSHKWNHQITAAANPQNFESVPIVDLTDPNAVSLIRHACEKWGVIQVINHGVPMNIIKDVELQAFELFSLPSERKVCALKSEGQLFGYGTHHVSPQIPKLLWSEGFTMMDSPVEHATKIWPNQPDQITKFCTVMVEHQKEMKKFCEKMTELMLESLGLTSEDIEWFKPKTGLDKIQSTLQLNSYPVCPEPDRALGLSPHTDTSLLTVLYQNTSGGLQAHQDGIGWLPVDAVPGALVVNVGDFMHILSNGQFKSLYHRAVVHNTQDRISFAYFYLPPKDVEFGPLMKLIDEQHPPLCGPVTWKEFLDKKSYRVANTKPEI